VVSPEPGAVHQARNTHLHPRPFWSNRIAHEIPHTGFHGHSYFRPQPHIFKALYNDADEVKRIFVQAAGTTDWDFPPVEKVDKSATWYYTALFGSSFCNSFLSNAVQVMVSAISLFRVFPVGSGSPFIIIKNNHHGVPIESFLFPDSRQTY
jgi:hypothetical protein